MLHIKQKKDTVNSKKFQEVLLYILNEIGFKSNVDKTVLFTILYFIDFDYYEIYEEQLTGVKYLKSKRCPTPCEFEKIVNELVQSGDLEIIISSNQCKKYLPCRRANISLFSAIEIQIVNSVLNKLSHMNAAKISEYSQNDIPWLSTEDGNIINYDFVFYRTTAYSVREYEESYTIF